MRLLTLLLIAISITAIAQYKPEEFQAGLLQAKYGAMLVYNGQKNSFTLKFVFKSVEPTERPNFVRVDGSLMQSTLFPIHKEYDFASLTEEEQKIVLQNWKLYEKKWVEDQLKSKLNEKEEFLKINDKLCLYWSYDMPTKKDDPYAVVKQMYLVTLCFDQTLVLNGPIEKGKSEIELRNKLTSVAKTLELKAGQVLDMKSLYYELKP